MSHAADFLAGDSILELSNLGPGPGLPLMRGVSDVTTDSDVAALGPGGLPASVSDQDIPTARWRATSAGLWPVRPQASDSAPSLSNMSAIAALLW